MGMENKMPDDIKKLQNLRDELVDTNPGDTFRHGEVVVKILHTLLNAEIDRAQKKST